MNRAAIVAIFSIFFLGVSVTYFTNQYVMPARLNEISQMDGQTMPVQPRLEDSIVESLISPLGSGRPAAASADNAADWEASQGYQRLMEIETQVNQLKEEQSMSGYSLKHIAEMELNLWEEERIAIHTQVAEQNSMVAEQLKQQEQNWFYERDYRIAEALKNKNRTAVSYNSTEYIMILAELTREHVYELAKQYQNELERI